jgi:hypothetical protein
MKTYSSGTQKSTNFGPHFRPILGVPGVRAGPKNTFERAAPMGVTWMTRTASLGSRLCMAGGGKRVLRPPKWVICLILTLSALRRSTLFMGCRADTRDLSSLGPRADPGPTILGSRVPQSLGYSRGPRRTGAPSTRRTGAPSTVTQVPATPS